MNFPRQPNGEGGWTIDPAYLRQVVEKLVKTQSYPADMETVEVVLLAVEEPFLKDEELITNAEVALSEENEALQRRINALKNQVGQLWDYVRKEWLLADDSEDQREHAFMNVKNKMKELGLDALTLSKRE